MQICKFLIMLPTPGVIVPVLLLLKVVILHLHKLTQWKGTADSVVCVRERECALAYVQCKAKPASAICLTALSHPYGILSLTLIACSFVQILGKQ